MIAKTTPKEFEVLQHFYLKLKGTVLSQGNTLEKESLFLTLIKMSLNKTSKMLAESTISRFSFETDIIKSLSSKQLIRLFDDFENTNEYMITAFGIWQIESIEKEWSIGSLIQYFQETKFIFKIKHKPLKDIEKIPLFAMMVMRTYSNSVPMDINEKLISDAWINIFDSCANFLHEKMIIKKSKWNTSRRGNEHPISYVMRRSNELPQKSRHIYCNLGHNMYFLDIDNEERDKNLLFLMKLMFGKIDSDSKEEIYSFMTDLAYDQSKNIGGNNQYVSPEWDQYLEDRLYDCYLDI